MATYYSTQNPLVPKPSNLASGVSSELRRKIYTISIPADAAADEFVYVTPALPVGTTIWPHASYVLLSADPGSGTLALDIGLVAEDDLCSVIDVSAGGKFAFDVYQPITSTATYSQVKVKLETLTGDVGAVTIYLDLAYTCT